MTILGYQHGQIKCGSLLVNDIDRSRALYVGLLDQEVVEQGKISALLAASWSAPLLTDTPYCLLQPKGSTESNINSYLRLIQSPANVTPIAHATTYGWCAYEISVQDVFALEKKLQGSEFTVVGPPKHLDGIANVIPMQVVGPDQEVLFLNQVLASDEMTDLPQAKFPVDKLFIMVLASPDREASVEDYCREFKLQDIQTHELRYGLINRAFNLSAETTHSLNVLQQGRLPVIEIDQYPAAAKKRPQLDDSLPLGNAMVSLAVDNLDDLPLDNKLSPESFIDYGLLYAGRRSIVVRGRANELIELIEHS